MKACTCQRSRPSSQGTCPLLCAQGLSSASLCRFLLLSMFNHLEQAVPTRWSWFVNTCSSTAREFHGVPHTQSLGKPLWLKLVRCSYSPPLATYALLVVAISDICSAGRRSESDVVQRCVQETAVSFSRMRVDGTQVATQFLAPKNMEYHTFDCKRHKQDTSRW